EQFGRTHYVKSARNNLNRPLQPRSNGLKSQLKLEDWTASVRILRNQLNKGRRRRSISATRKKKKETKIKISTDNTKSVVLYTYRASFFVCEIIDVNDHG
ncbi:hypothetical protein LINGRAHAP2_LOCUS15036, partial [Linum grandiflorum]